MTAKDKAKELFDKYDFLKEIFIPSIHEQKKCALIAVNLRLDGDFIFSSIEYGGEESLEYWIEVKKEIEKI